MKQQIKRLEDPSLKCCQLVYDELIRILSQLLGKVVSDSRVVQLMLLLNETPHRTASVQAVPSAQRPSQFRRRYLLQERYEPDE